MFFTVEKGYYVTFTHKRASVRAWLPAPPRRYALDLHKEDYNDETEKDLVEQVFTNAIASLSADDQQLPSVEALLPLLRRGIGIHHGGLLPILKEIVEILFSEGLIKCLFATETFSIGINMPAKTVVFTDLRKWDGTQNRWVTSGEYVGASAEKS